jgi:hypothetical protein
VLIYPTTLSLIVTHRCTAACEHCCFACHPGRSEEIPYENLRKYIVQASQVPSIKLVVFTGGECFLLGKKLDELVGLATSLGLATRFVSNGYWAINPTIAKKRLTTLKERGLGEANFSTGDFHSQYVAPENVVHGSVAACELGLDTCVMVETFNNSTFDYHYLSENPALAPYLSTGKLKILRSPWMEFKGQREMRYEATDIKSWHERKGDGGCQTVFNTLTVKPSEHLVACCGLTLEEIPEMWLGDLKTRTILEIITEQQDDFIKIWIHMEGPKKIYEYARKLNPSIQPPLEKAHICDICRAMYGDEKIRAILRHSLPANYLEIIEAYQKRINNSRLLQAISKASTKAA